MPASPATNGPPPGYWTAPSPYPTELYDPSPSAPAIPPVVAAGPPAALVEKAPRPFTFGATLAASAVSETNATSVVLSPLLEGAYEVDPAILLDLAWGFAWLLDNQGLGESAARVGNALASGYYRSHIGGWRIRGGIGITAPMAHYPLGPDGRLYAFIYNQTLATSGMWNQWLWTTDRMAVPLSAHADYAFQSGHVLAAEAAIASLSGVRSGASGTDIVGQVAIEARLSMGEKFDVCPRLQAVLLPSSSVDRLQMAFGLRGILHTSSGRYFAGLLVNLDEPLGIFGGLGRWGLHLGKEIDL